MMTILKIWILLDMAVFAALLLNPRTEEGMLKHRGSRTNEDGGHRGGQP
jgi:hypothetical protein